MVYNAIGDDGLPGATAGDEGIEFIKEEDGRLRGLGTLEKLSNVLFTGSDVLI